MTMGSTSYMREIFVEDFFGSKCLRAKSLFRFGWPCCIGVHPKRVNTV